VKKIFSSIKKYLRKIDYFYKNAVYFYEK